MDKEILRIVIIATGHGCSYRHVGLGLYKR